METEEGYQIDIYSYNDVTKKTGDVETLGPFDTYNEASKECSKVLKELPDMWITYFRTKEEHECSSINVELIEIGDNDICNAYQISWNTVMNGEGVVSIW